MYFSKFQQFNYLFLFFLVICMQLQSIVQEVNIPMLFISGHRAFFFFWLVTPK